MTRQPTPEEVASWPAPNYDDPETQGPDLLIAQLILLPVALITLLARLYVRFVMVKRAGWDDWLMIAAMFFSCAVTVNVILATELYGWNIHIWDLTPDQVTKGRKASIVAQTLFLFASALVKLSILTSYLRIALLGSWLRILTKCCLVLVTLLLVTFLIVLWTQCIPAWKYWSFSRSEHCMDQGPPLTAQVTATTVSDLIIVVLPLPTICRLNLPRAQHILILLIFSIGLIVVFAGGMRLYWVVIVMWKSYDRTWDGFRLWIWTAVEVNLGVWCGCAPMLRPLLRRCKESVQRGSNSRNSSSDPLRTDSNGPAVRGRINPEPVENSTGLEEDREKLAGADSHEMVAVRPELCRDATPSTQGAASQTETSGSEDAKRAVEPTGVQ